MSIRVRFDTDSGELVMAGRLVSPAQVAAAVRDYQASGGAELDQADLDALLAAAGCTDRPIRTVRNSGSEQAD